MTIKIKDQIIELTQTEYDQYMQEYKAKFSQFKTFEDYVKHRLSKVNESTSNQELLLG